MRVLGRWQQGEPSGSEIRNALRRSWWRGWVRGERGRQCIQAEELKNLSDGRVRLLRGGTAARGGFEGTGETRGGHNGAKGPAWNPLSVLLTGGPPVRRGPGGSGRKPWWSRFGPDFRLESQAEKFAGSGGVISELSWDLCKGHFRDTNLRCCRGRTEG